MDLLGQGMTQVVDAVLLDVALDDACVHSGSFRFEVSRERAALSERGAREKFRGAECTAAEVRQSRAGVVQTGFSFLVGRSVPFRKSIK
jgi:hypothetical protein